MVSRKHSKVDGVRRKASVSTQKTCFFTIVSRNYLHYAKTLVKSIQANCSSCDCAIALCDSAEGIDIDLPGVEIITLDKLDIPEFSKFAFRYTILEMNTAIKPYVISRLFSKGFQKVFYLDPDIKVYHSLQGMIDLLDRDQMILTPHLTDHLEDSKSPDELTIIRSGTYNLGYIGIRNTADMKRFASWWKRKLYTDCVNDVSKGLFVDQKWMDLVPGMYSGVFINRDPGWNVAYWNLSHRSLKDDKGQITVNGEPLTFFHFSGFSPNEKTLSKHQNRFTRKNAGEVVSRLCDHYAEDLLKNGMEEYQKIPYAYGFFPTGVPIPELARYIYRDEHDWENDTNDLWTTQGAFNFMGYLNEPITLSGLRLDCITRLAYKLYRSRADLQECFPDLTGFDQIRFAHWFVDNAAEQTDMADVFIAPVRHALSFKESGAPGLYRGESKLSLGYPGRLYRFLYQFGWRHQKPLLRLLPRWLITQGNNELLRKVRGAYDNQVALSTFGSEENTFASETSESEAYPLGYGLNVYGYVQAESGIGQSVRSTIQALLSIKFPFSVVDFREGNISRMNEKIPEEILGEPAHNTNLFHINADQTPHAIEHIGPEQLEGKYNIGYWAWELPEFPDEWVGASKFLDEIWVPSSFCQKAIAKKISIPVRVIPHSLAIAANELFKNRNELNLQNDDFIFLSMFDCLSVPERKNIFAVIEAFKKAELPAKLVIKVTNLGMEEEYGARLFKEAELNKDIILIDGYWERNDIHSLLNCCDVFVSLHRSEGFGLGMAEAMYLGKPVIASGWSGNLEFMNKDNSFLVRYKLISLEKDYGPYKKGNTWCSPDVDRAASYMRELFEDEKKRLEVGRIAQRSIRKQLSPESIGRLIENHLLNIRMQQQNQARNPDIPEVIASVVHP